MKKLQLVLLLSCLCATSTVFGLDQNADQSIPSFLLAHAIPLLVILIVIFLLIVKSTPDENAANLTPLEQRRMKFRNVLFTLLRKLAKVGPAIRIITVIVAALLLIAHYYGK